MEMSHDYMRETVAKMTGHGFTADEEHAQVPRRGAASYARHTYELVRGESEHLVLECLIYPDGSETYWLELRRMGTIHTFPFPLDSWKWRDDHVEFSFYGRHDGSALSFVLRL